MSLIHLQNVSIMKKTKKIKNIEDFNKVDINCRHINLFNTALDSVEILLKNFLAEIQNSQDNPLELSKNLIATLDFLISAISKIQKGQRIALNLDKNTMLQDSEPQINIIEGINFDKV